MGNKTLKLVGDITGPAALLAFGLALWHYQASENLFSFAAWGTLDILMGTCMYYACAKKESVLPIAYGIIAFFVTVMIYRNGKWQWTLVETVCLAGTIIGIIGWWRLGALFGVVAFGAAMSVASIPILVSNYHNPQTWEWWLWVGGGVSATIGLYLTRPLTLQNIGQWLFVAVSAVVTALMLAIQLWPLV